MAKQQTSAPLIEKPKKFITKPKLEFQKTKDLEHIATSTNSSFIHLRTKGNVFVCIRPDSKDIKKILEPGTDKKDYRFERINSEELRKKFLEATKDITPINPIKYTLLKDNVYLYLYSIGNKRRIYTIAEALYTENIS